MNDIDPETASAWRIGLHDAALAGWFNEATHELAAGFPISPTDVVLDVGCGDGGHASFCGRRGARILLTDVDQGKLAAATRALGDIGGCAVEGRVADGKRLPFEDGIASRVICTEVLEHVDDPVETVAELARVLRPGGLLLATVPGAAQERVQTRVAPPFYFEKPNHIRIIERGELRSLIEGAGLLVERESADGFFWSVYFAFFWEAKIEIGGSHPILDLWARSWLRTISGPDGPAIKRALDAALPKRTVIVARKPAL